MNGLSREKQSKLKKNRVQEIRNFSSSNSKNNLKFQTKKYLRRKSNKLIKNQALLKHLAPILEKSDLLNRNKRRHRRKKSNRWRLYNTSKKRRLLRNKKKMKYPKLRN